MAPAERKPLYFTFANHMHWVDMTWLWGHEVLGRSVRDMLRLARESGARGNVNFDAAGYERLALEDPDALDELRRAVADGTIEVVGGSYGQPYGLFHGGESNVRQRVLGARVVRRLLGVWPKAFWEEEFDFFPQLPQILSGCGFEGACLFFQWTWHTPSVPEESAPLVMWEGLDGTQLPSVPSSALCLHQWPEDFEGRLEHPLIAEQAEPALLQWVELLPSPDWMCRSEVLLPKLRELFADGRFELRPVTLSQLIASRDSAAAPKRAYGLDDVWHGVSLGKNGDFAPRFSRTCEEQLLAAESIATLCGLLGRPYPSWDIYPHWELEEAWKDLCIAQHHDVHECEGLCGSIGERFFEKSQGLAGEVFARSLEHLAGRVDAPEGTTLVYNALGWTRDVSLPGDAGGGVVRDVPAFGYRVVDMYDVEDSRLGVVDMRSDESLLSFERRHLRVEIDRASGLVTQVYSREFPDGLLDPEHPFGRLEMLLGGEPERFDKVTFEGGGGAEGEEWAEFAFVREGRDGSRLRVTYGIAPLHEALWMRVVAERLARPDPGVHAALSLPLRPRLADQRLLVDHPYGVGEVRAERDHLRKYPTGEWMTSPQVFETVRRPFTASSLLDLCEADPGGRGLLVVHDGSQAWLREEHGVRAVLSLYDPWDEDYFDEAFEAELFLLPHGALTNTARVRTSMELNLGAPRFADHAPVRGGGDLPPDFGALAVDAPNVLATALQRVPARDAEHLPRHFAAHSGAREPFVVRLVELDGREADVLLRVPGGVARAARTDLLGQVLEDLVPTAASAPSGPRGIPWSGLRLRLRPNEIATVMLDLELGRQVPRDLDRHRQVWARVHRRGQA
jgi:alpha-mannosidase